MFMIILNMNILQFIRYYFLNNINIIHFKMCYIFIILLFDIFLNQLSFKAKFFLFLLNRFPALEVYLLKIFGGYNGFILVFMSIF